MTVSLDGVALGALDSAVRVLEVREKPHLAVSPAGARRTQLQVTLRLEVHEKEAARRRTVLAQVQRWAEGRLLRVGDRPGRVLPVRLNALPAAGAADWCEALEVDFRSARMPWWVGESAVQSAGEGTAWMNVQTGGVTRTVYRCADTALPPGDAGAHGTARLTNTGAGTLTMATLTAGARSLRFNGLSVAPGERLEISLDSAGLLTARAGGVSVLDCRSADSDDDLRVPGGMPCAWAATADQPFAAVIDWWGWYR